VMSKMLVIAQKEYLDAMQSKLFLVLLICLLLLIVTSIVVASFDFQNKLVEYNKALRILQKLGKTPDTSIPVFFPLKMLRGVINYLEIIGAILGIILGYLSIAKEKGKNTLQLILSRPLGRFDLVSGKVLGNSGLIFSVLAVASVGMYLILWAVGGVWFSTAEIVKLGLVFLFSAIYMLFFFCLTSILALKLASLPNALIISFVIWLTFVLIIPQIGDTMDPDNQIPGGFFRSMKIAKPQEQAILAKFHTYETVRNALEESSVTKHYERLSFALLGIKDEYNNKPLGVIFRDKWRDGVWVLMFFLITLLIECRVLVKTRLMTFP
jgi:ABC-type transport system involved in multi-copper enzyme maturation permease subunit